MALEKAERTCECCDDITAAYMTMFDDGDFQFIVCFKCLSSGIKWIVQQSRKI